MLRGIHQVRQPQKFCHPFCNTQLLFIPFWRPEFTINIPKAAGKEPFFNIKILFFALILPQRPCNLVRNVCLHIWHPSPLQSCLLSSLCDKTVGVIQRVTKINVIEEAALMCRNQHASPPNLNANSCFAFGAMSSKEIVGLFPLIFESRENINKDLESEIESLKLCHS